MIRLLVVASSAVVRAGLEALAGSHPGIALAGVSADLSEVEELRPDVVLADVPVGELAPPSHGTPPAFVLLTSEARPPWSRDALRFGVRAMLPRNASAGEILAAVEAAASGMAVLDPRDLESLLAASPPAPQGPAPALTAREIEVLGMMAEGAANKTIAWKLSLSEHTVKFHVASILGKLNASSRTEAVSIGIRKGLVQI